jgi:hypothetical protein
VFELLLGLRTKLRSFVDNRRWLCVPLLLLCAAEAGFAQAKHEWGNPSVDGADLTQTLQRYTPVAEEPSVAKRANAKCLEWKNSACTVCGIGSAVDILLRPMTKTPILLCRDMKPGPARVVMSTHAEPAIHGLWEVEFGLGYQTSARAECPHQFIASDHPPLKTAYEVGPVTIEGEISTDGTIQVLACVGLSSARVGGEGKETGASLRVFKLRVVSE